MKPGRTPQPETKFGVTATPRDLERLQAQIDKIKQAERAADRNQRINR